MAEIILKNTYDAVLEEFKDRQFYIFGSTVRAQIFYLYCKEKGVHHRIRAFVLSDTNQYKGNVRWLHGISLVDISQAVQTGETYGMFLAAGERTVREQLMPLLENGPWSRICYVSDFLNDYMFCRCKFLFYKDIASHYLVSENRHEAGHLNLSDPYSTDYYKYIPGITRGICPDPDIFRRKIPLDVLFRRQLGCYMPVDRLERPDGCERSCRIYTTISHYDQKLKETFHMPGMALIQAGAELTDADLAPLKDNSGDHISGRNRDYCDMSAVYWAWKNDTDSDYIGLCHYRRRFVLDEPALWAVMSGGYDAVYTVPKLTDGGMREEFVERNGFLTPEMWEYTGSVIASLTPEYSDSWIEFEKSFFLIPCNMFIMRRDIFEDYCGWVFTVLMEVDRYYMDQGIQHNNRYLGYLAECLNTVYAMKHKNRLRKVFVEYKLLETL